MPGLDKNKFFDALQNWPSQPTLAELKEQKEFLVKALDIIIRLPDIAREERTQILIHIVDAIRNIDEQIKIKKAKK